MPSSFMSVLVVAAACGGAFIGGLLEVVGRAPGPGGRGALTVVVTRTRQGARGVEPKPNRTGGSTTVSEPRSRPPWPAVAAVIRCRSRAPYHSYRPPPAVPRV